MWSAYLIYTVKPWLQYTDTMTFRLFIDLSSASNFLSQLQLEGFSWMAYEINKMSSEESVTEVKNIWSEDEEASIFTTEKVEWRIGLCVLLKGWLDWLDCADGCEYSKFHRKRNESKNTEKQFSTIWLSVVKAGTVVAFGDGLLL